MSKNETNKGGGDAATTEQTPEQKELARLRQKVSKLEDTVTEQAERLSVQEATKGSTKPNVKVDGQHVQVQHAVKLKDGTVKSMKDIAADKDLCAELLRNGSSAVKVITTK